MQNNKHLSIGIVLGGYLDQSNHLMDRKELNRRISGLQKLVTKLNQDLFQQRFNNKHNLSIDGVISNKIMTQEQKLETLSDAMMWLKYYHHDVVDSPNTEIDKFIRENK
jgi:hypothetical protein